MKEVDCCPGKPDLASRELLSTEQASEIGLLFKVLSNDTRLRILHCLTREPKLSVSKIAEKLNMKIAAISNQLQRLVDQKIIKAKRDGNFINYEISDPCTAILLDRAWCLAEDTGKVSAHSIN